jgi:ribosome-binding protein aMBF1 (putative translation factor)
MRGSGTYLYYMTMARIRAPFGGEIISPKNTRQTNTIDNVKAKIDNFKAKIQDKKEKRHWSRPTLARRPVFC